MILFSRKRSAGPAGIRRAILLAAIACLVSLSAPHFASATTAVRFDASGDGVAFVPQGSEWDQGGVTMMGWAYISNAVSAAASLIQIRGAGLLFLDSSNKLYIYTDNAYTNDTVIPAGEWHHFTLVTEGGDPATWRVYVDGVADVVSTAPAGTDNVRPLFGNSDFDDWFDGRMTAGKIWRAALTPSEIQAEMHSYAAVRTADLWSEVHMTSPTDLTDQSGQGNSAVANGILATEGGPDALDITPPTVSLTAPSNGATVSGSAVALTATATDDVAMAGVQFKLDNTTNIGPEDTAPPYAASFDSTGVPGGAHTIVAVARDHNGNYATSSAVTVTVQNTVPVTIWSTPNRRHPRVVVLPVDNVASGSTSAGTESTRFSRDLGPGAVDPDVRALQQYLNAHGALVAVAGPGSPGKETNLFGALTRAALIRFQELHAAEILMPAGFVRGTGYLGPNTRAFLNR